MSRTSVFSEVISFLQKFDAPNDISSINECEESSTSTLSLEEEIHRRMLERENEESQREQQRKERNEQRTDWIPRFYVKRKENPLFDLTRRIATQLHIAKEESSLLSNDELETLYDQGDEICQRGINGSKRMSFYEFMKLGQKLHESKMNQYFSASLFLKLPRDQLGRIDHSHLANFVDRGDSQKRWRLFLARFDDDLDQKLKREDIREILLYVAHESIQMEIFEKIAQESRDMRRWSLSADDLIFHYVEAGIAKFQFFHDQSGKGIISIDQLMTDSPVLPELMEVAERAVQVDEQNWFSVDNLVRLIGHFHELDADDDGIVSLETMLFFNGSSMTSLAMQRVFDVLDLSYERMDFFAFVSLVLAVENRQTLPSYRFHWKMLDISSRGYLTIADLNMFFREILQRLGMDGGEHQDEEGWSREDVLGELFDMIAPKNPLQITLDDIISSEMGHLFFGILTDTRMFTAYEMRGGQSDSADHFEEEDGFA